MKNSFDRPTDADFEAMINKNVVGVEWEEYDTDNGKVSYPFWKSVIAGNGQTHDDFMKWLASMRSVKMVDNTGVVTPKADFDVDTTTKPTVVHDYKTSIVEKLAELQKVHKLDEFEDNTGVVKPKSEVKVEKVEEVKSSSLKAGDLKDLTGAVKPKSEVKTKKVKPLPEADKLSSETDLTGTVKPSAEFGTNAKPIIDNDFSEPVEPVVDMNFFGDMLSKFKNIKIED